MLLRKWLDLYIKRIISNFVKRIFFLIKLISAKHQRRFWYKIRFCFKIFHIIIFYFSSYCCFRVVRLKNLINNLRRIFNRCILIIIKFNNIIWLIFFHLKWFIYFLSLQFSIFLWRISFVLHWWKIFTYFCFILILSKTFLKFLISRNYDFSSIFCNEVFFIIFCYF